MSLKQALQKRQNLIRIGYIAVCLIGTVVVIAVGYSFFHDRMQVFSVFTAYILFMAGVVIAIGLRLLTMILS